MSQILEGRDGQRFFNRQLPELIKGIASLAKSAEIIAGNVAQAQAPIQDTRAEMIPGVFLVAKSGTDPYYPGMTITIEVGGVDVSTVALIDYVPDTYKLRVVTWEGFENDNKDCDEVMVLKYNLAEEVKKLKSK